MTHPVFRNRQEHLSGSALITSLMVSQQILSPRNTSYLGLQQATPNIRPVLSGLKCTWDGQTVCVEPITNLNNTRTCWQNFPFHKHQKRSYLGFECETVLNVYFLISNKHQPAQTNNIFLSTMNATSNNNKCPAE